MHATTLIYYCIYAHLAGALLHSTVRDPSRKRTRGILIGGSSSFNVQILTALDFLRKHDVRLPIQIWQSGHEISDELANDILNFPGVEIRDIHEPNAKHWQGYQIKALMVEKSEFDEIIIVDADVRAQRNFEDLFQDPKYLQTGTLFFRDRKQSQLPNAKWLSVHNISIPFTSVVNVVSAATQLVNSGADTNRPCEVNCSAKALNPPLSPSHAHEIDNMGFHGQCSSVVVLNKTKHALGIQHLVELNRDWNNTYQFMHGDRDTFWISMAMAHEPFAFVATLPGHDEEAGWMGEASYFYTDDGILNHIH